MSRWVLTVMASDWLTEWKVGIWRGVRFHCLRGWPLCHRPNYTDRPSPHKGALSNTTFESAPLCGDGRSVLWPVPDCLVPGPHSRDQCQTVRRLDHAPVTSVRLSAAWTKLPWPVSDCPPPGPYGPNSRDQCQTARRLDLMDQTPVTSVKLPAAWTLWTGPISVHSVRLPAAWTLWTKLPWPVSDCPPPGPYGPNSRDQCQTARRLDLMDQTPVTSVRLPAAWTLWTKLPWPVSDCPPPGPYGPNSRDQCQTARRLDLMDQTPVTSVRLSSTTSALFLCFFCVPG